MLTAHTGDKATRHVCVCVCLCVRERARAVLFQIWRSTCVKQHLAAHMRVSHLLLLLTCLLLPATHALITLLPDNNTASYNSSNITSAYTNMTYRAPTYPYLAASTYGYNITGVLLRVQITSCTQIQVRQGYSTRRVSMSMSMGVGKA